MNAIGGHLFAGAVLEADAAGAPSAAPLPGRDGQAQGDPGEATEVQSLEQLQEAVGSREMQFAPEKGNVLFASAIHGWAFDLRVFAQLFARKLGVREPLLQRVAGRQVGTAPAPGSSAPYALFSLGICLSVATPDPPPPLLIWPG